MPTGIRGFVPPLPGPPEDCAFAACGPATSRRRTIARACLMEVFIDVPPSRREPVCAIQEANKATRLYCDPRHLYRINSARIINLAFHFYRSRQPLRSTY